MAVDIGPRIGIEGEAEYRKQINQIITQSKTLSSEMKVVESSFNAETTAQEKAAKKAEVLNKQVQTQTERVSLLTDMLEKSKKETGENSTQTLKWQQAVNNANADLNRMKRELNEAEEGAKGYGTGVDEATEGTKEFDQTAQLLAKQQLAEFWGKASEAVRKVASATIGAAKELDDGYDTIIKKTGATGEAFDELKQSADAVFRSMPVEMSDVGEAIGEINSRFGLTGDALTDLSKEFLQFANINDTDVNASIETTSRLLKAFGLETEDAANVLGLMTDASQRSGIEIDKLMSAIDSNGSVLRSLGFSLEDSVALLTAFESEGVESTGAMTALKKAVQNAAKQGKDANTVLHDAYQGIKDAATETEALQIATETFGTKGAVVMADGIRNGRISLEDATKSIAEYGDVVSRTYEETLDPWDKTKVAMNNLKTVGSQLAGQALATLVPAIEKVTGVVQKVADWFSKLSPTAQKVLGIVTALGGGMALLAPKVMTVIQTFSMMKTAAAATRALATSTQGAETAQKAFNLAVLANPIVAITAGIIAATAAVAALAYALADATEESVAFKDNSKAIAESAKESASSVQQLADEAAASVAQFQAQSEVADELVDTIETLSKKEGKSAEEVRELQDAVRKLNDIYPELNLQYDEAADNLSMTNAELRQNIQLTQDQAKAQAYARLYNDLIDKQMQLQIDLRAVENQRNAGLGENAELIDKVVHRGALMQLFHMDEAKSVKNLNDGYKALNTTHDELTRADENYTAQMEILRGELEALGYTVDPVTGAFEGLVASEDGAVEGTNAVTAAVEASKASVESYIPAWDSLSASQRETAEKVAQAYRDMESAVTNSINSQMSMFEAYGEVEEVRTEDLLANMQSQIDGVTNWEQNLTTLANRGINQGMLQYLLEMGPKGAKYVQAFVNMSDEEFARANSLWKQSVDIKGFTNDVGRDLKAGLAQIAGDMDDTGLNLGAGLARGITESKALVIAAAKDMAAAARDTTKNVLQVQSPSKVFEWIGEMVGEGFEKGVNESMPTIPTPFNDVGMISGRDSATGLDPNAIYSAVRAGAENAETKIVIGDREFARILRGMGVAMA